MKKSKLVKLNAEVACGRLFCIPFSLFFGHT